MVKLDWLDFDERKQQYLNKSMGCISDHGKLGLCMEIWKFSAARSKSNTQKSGDIKNELRQTISKM